MLPGAAVALTIATRAGVNATATGIRSLKLAHTIKERIGLSRILSRLGVEPLISRIMGLPTEKISCGVSSGSIRAFRY